jgi:hypothetical protein
MPPSGEPVMTGSGMAFDDRGLDTLNGFSDPRRLFRARPGCARSAGSELRQIQPLRRPDN